MLRLVTYFVVTVDQQTGLELPRGRHVQLNAGSVCMAYSETREDCFFDVCSW